MPKDVGKSNVWIVQINPLGSRHIVADTLEDVAQTVEAMSPGATITELKLQNEVFGDKKALK